MFETEIYQRRRDAAMATMGAGVAVLPAGPARPRTRTSAYPYRPDADFWWLTGLAEPDAVLVLAPEGPVKAALFVPARDPAHERWEGARLGPEAAPAALGVDAAWPLDELDARLPGLLRGAEPLWYGFGREAAFDQRLLALWPRLAERRRPGPRTIKDPGGVLHPLRLRKAPEELAAMRRAAALTAAGFAAARARVADGVPEHALEAALTGAWRAGGADGPAYNPIVAAGANATVLHHTRADGVLRAGELVLVDAGAEWRGYACDVTRTWAVGEVDGRRRAAWEGVKAAHAAAIAATRPGAPLPAPSDAARAVLADALADLGLGAGALERYFPHAVGHWIGLEVHDPVVPEVATLAAGMAMTVEPGLYFPADDEAVPAELRGVGIRIEDTVVVADGEAEVLTAAIPYS